MFKITCKAEPSAGKLHPVLIVQSKRSLSVSHAKLMLSSKDRRGYNKNLPPSGEERSRQCDDASSSDGSLARHECRGHLGPPPRPVDGPAHGANESAVQACARGPAVTQRRQAGRREDLSLLPLHYGEE